MVGGGFGEYYAYWNREQGAPISNDFEELGSVKRFGSCWIGPKVTVCFGEPDPVAPKGSNSICEDCG